MGYDQIPSGVKRAGMRRGKAVRCRRCLSAPKKREQKTHIEELTFVRGPEANGRVITRATIRHVASRGESRRGGTPPSPPQRAPCALARPRDRKRVKSYFSLHVGLKGRGRGDHAWCVFAVGGAGRGRALT
jgi:hypothetical protein